MHPDLARTDYHAAPGDVLLLRSRSAGRLNRAGQWLQRRQGARFTHVALVLDDHRIVDAVPRGGVGIRHWPDLEARYDIAACEVARHRHLAADPAGFEQVLRQALYYIQQPYRLRTVLRDRGAVQDQSGLVCSHFVAALLHRLGVRVADRPATATLPVDIDRHTARSAEWRRFPLASHRLFSGARPPPPGDAYWAALSAVQPALAADEQAQAQTVAERLLEEALSGRTAEFDAFLASSDALRQRSQALNDEIDRLSARMVDQQLAASRQVGALEDRLLALLEDAAAGAPEALAAARASLAREANAPPPALGGAALLREWHAVFLLSDQPAPVFLHEVAHSDRLARRRDLLARLVAQAREVARRQLEGHRAFEAVMRRTVALARQGSIGTDTLRPLRAMAAALLEAGRCLGGDDLVTIDARLDDLDARTQDLLRWRTQHQPEPTLWQQAVALFTEIGRFDLDCREWLAVAEPSLRLWIAALGLQAEPPASARG